MTSSEDIVAWSESRCRALRDEGNSRSEVPVPTIVADLVREIDQAGADHGAVEQEAAVQERHRSNVNLLQGEKSKQDESHSYHSNNVICLPTIGCGSR